jgi:hypothetical protein
MIEGVYDDVELVTEESMMPRSFSSRCYGGGGVDDAGAPQVVAVAEVGSMMPEPLEPLLWWMQS